jgi:hypothetical protein
MPEGGIIATDQVTGEPLGKLVEPFQFNGLEHSRNLCILCISNSFADLLKQEFGAEACIEISNKRKFFVRLESALP